VKKLTAIVGVIFVMAAALIAPGWIDEHPAGALALGVAAVLVIIGLALVAGVFIGGIWTTRTMRAGADIALRAQQVNDEWDAKKTAAFAGLMREGAVIGRQAPGALPALPTTMGGLAVGQGEVFSLPPLAEFGGRQFQVIDQDEVQDGR
jgi:hypothetical protein